MLKTIEDISATRKRLRIEIPPETIEGEYQNGLAALRRKARIPGFRPGKAPASMLEKRYGKDIEGEVMEKLVPEYYAGALKEANLKPVSRPEFEEKLEFKRNSPLRMTLTVEVRPEIKDLQYAGVKVRDIPVKVEASEVEAAMEDIRKKRAVYEPSEGAAEHGDLVALDYTTSGEGQEAAEHKDQTYKVGHGIMPEAFANEIKGMQKGNEKEFDTVFPADFPSEDVAGKTVRFKVSVKEVKRPVLPSVDDEFAKDLSFDDLAALRAHVEAEIKRSREATVRKMQKAEAVSKILADHPFDAPEGMVEAEISRLVADARQAGRKEAEDALRAELKPAAVNHMRATVLLDIVGEKENVQVSDEEARSKVESLATLLRMPPENVMKYYIARDGSLDGLRHEVFEEKVLDLILAKADMVKGENE